MFSYPQLHNKLEATWTTKGCHSINRDEKGLPSSREGDTEQLVLSDELPAKPSLKGILRLQPSNPPEVVTKTGEACGTIRLMRVASWPIPSLGGC